MSNILSTFDGGDIEEISALIDKLEKSSFDYLKLESDGLSIVIGKNGAGDTAAAGMAAPAAAYAAPAGAALTAAPPASAPSASPTAAQADVPAAQPA